MKTVKKIQIYRFIMGLIYPHENFKNNLKFNLNNDDFRDMFVAVGSSYLILPFLNSKLKKFDYSVPKELRDYLNKISIANSERNKNIFKQISFISETFNKNKIEHVFLKGAALMISNYDLTVNERMIGDIDILVSENKINCANKLLIDLGFNISTNDVQFFSKNLVKKRHLERLTHKKFIAAVELHIELVDEKFEKLLPSKIVLATKRKFNNNFWIPSEKILWLHSILNWQVNDKGYQYNRISFRAIIDALFFEPLEINKTLNKKTDQIKHFYSLISFFNKNYQNNHPVRRFLFKISVESIYFNRVIYHAISLKLYFVTIFKKLILFINSNEYRKRILDNPFLAIQMLTKKLSE